MLDFTTRFTVICGTYFTMDFCHFCGTLCTKDRSFFSHWGEASLFGGSFEVGQTFDFVFQCLCKRECVRERERVCVSVSIGRQLGVCKRERECVCVHVRVCVTWWQLGVCESECVSVWIGTQFG